MPDHSERPDDRGQCAAAPAKASERSADEARPVRQPELVRADRADGVGRRGGYEISAPGEGLQVVPEDVLAVARRGACSSQLRPRPCPRRYFITTRRCRAGWDRLSRSSTLVLAPALSSDEATSYRSELSAHGPVTRPSARLGRGARVLALADRPRRTLRAVYAGQVQRSRGSRGVGAGKVSDQDQHRRRWLSLAGDPT
jgi:hypothetical protein